MWVVRLLPPGGPDPFRFAQPEGLSAVLRSAGFRAVEEETKACALDLAGYAGRSVGAGAGVAVPFRPMLDRVPEDMWPRDS